MRYSKARIAGLGAELPPETLSSAEIEERLAPLYARIGLHPGRLELLTGIKERRFWPGSVRPSEVAARAGQKAIEASGVDKHKIGCLIHASVSRDFLEPATANVVHHALGLSPGAVTFDVSNACLGVLNGILIAANMIELGQVEAALVVAGENGRPLVEHTIQSLLADPSVTRKSIKGAIASLTIGSGAVAVLVSAEGLAPEGHSLRAAAVRSASEHYELCQGGQASAGHAPLDAGVQDGSALSMSTDGEALLYAGIKLAEQTWADLGQVIPAYAPDRVITHQVGKAHSKALFSALKLDPDASFTTYESLGNVGSVSLPITLALAEEAGVVAAGQEVALLGIGSGLSCMMMAVRW